MRRALTLVASAVAVTLPVAAPAVAQAPHATDHAAPAPAAPLLGAPPPVAMADKIFAPGAVTALVGEPVTWVNDDRIAHDVATLDGSYDSGRMEPGARTQHVFTTQGDVQYRCKLHRFMFGRVRVFGLALAAGSSSTPGGRAKLEGRAAPGTGEVTIEQRGPDGAFSTVGAARPGADGTFSAEVAPRAPSAFRARIGELTSPEVRVAVAPRLTVRAQRHGRHIVLSVRATPGQRGAPVVLQRYRRERFDFRTVAKGELSRGSSATFELHSSHWERLRVVLVRGVGGYGSSISRPVAVPVGHRRVQRGHAGH